MAGLPWIKVWTAVRDHPKVQRLERELGVKDALGIVIRLWCWTADYHPGGEIPEADGATAAKAARGDSCRKSNREMLDALVTSGLLDPLSGAYRVHDWNDMQTVHVEAEARRKTQAAERQQRYRERHGNATSNASRNANVTPLLSPEKEKEREIEKKQGSVTLAATPPDSKSAFEAFKHFGVPLDAKSRTFVARKLKAGMSPVEAVARCIVGNSIGWHNGAHMGNPMRALASGSDGVFKHHAREIESVRLDVERWISGSSGHRDGQGAGAVPERDAAGAAPAPGIPVGGVHGQGVERTVLRPGSPAWTLQNDLGMDLGLEPGAGREPGPVGGSGNAS